MTFWQVARRPRWIALLILALGLAALFAWLGKWQIERAVVQSVTSSPVTETIKPLTEITRPAEPVTDSSAGHRVTLDAQLDTSSVLTLSHRLNYGVDGTWVIGRATVLGDTSPGSLAVALGWASTDAQAEAVARQLRDSVTAQAFMPMTGRYLPAQEPVPPTPGQSVNAVTAMAPAALANLWPDDAPPYFTGYLVADAPPAGLSAIESIPPVSDASLNWLNVFYAVEWVVFAGFAVFLWYRLVRDARQRETDESATVT